MFGGFEDERRTSEDITETLLSVMQVSAEKTFIYCVIYCEILTFSAGSERQVQAGAGLHGASEHGDQVGGGLAQGVWGRGESGHWPGVLCPVCLPWA